MTVARLHRLLAKLIDQGHGHKPVAVNKRTFTHPLEGDGACILSVHGVRIEWIATADDDGGRKENADGSESGRITAVLFGETELDRRHE